MRLEQTCLDMIFQQVGWGLDLGLLKGSVTDFSFEIRFIFSSFLHCSLLFFSLFHYETRTNMFRHNFSTGHVGGSTRLGSRVQEQVLVSKFVAFLSHLCAVRASFHPIS